jgi:hypothetical protein
MQQFINKKSIFTAIQFTKENYQEVRNFIGENLLYSSNSKCYIKHNQFITPLKFGDWICELKGGGYDVIDNESFENTYIEFK